MHSGKYREITFGLRQKEQYVFLDGLSNFLSKKLNIKLEDVYSLLTDAYNLLTKELNLLGEEIKLTAGLEA
jgi:hypothetical protein